ncbi:sugar ABC transporter substrate-binding protein [Treponema sp. OttesenSCG-928-L16]|nr:sugar ABC transporter substrate-binding protein [Treponema sp. OttesenSCG-928-L16]
MNKRVGIAIIMAAVICGMLFSAGKQESSSGGRIYEGKTITLLIHPALYNAAGGDTGIKQEFEERTGARVDVVTAPIPEHSEKAMLDFLSRKGAYDVIAMQSGDMTKEFCSYFLPLDNYIKSSPEWGSEDIISSLMDLARVDGKQLGVPYRWTQVIMYYRKDLLNAAGVGVPKTVDQILPAARALTKDLDNDGKTDVYGFIAQGKAPEELSHSWLTAFYGYGGSIIGKDGRSGFNTEAGIKAASLWLTMYKEGIFPPDFFAWGRDDTINAMAQGKGAMGNFVASYYGNFFSGTVSREQIGFAISPGNGINRGGGWNLVINKDSKNPDIAWDLVKELTSKENQIREAVLWANGPIRNSTFEAEEFIKLWPQAEEMKIATQMQIVDPAIKETPKIHEAVTEELTAIMMERKSPSQGMTDLARKVDRLLGF